MRRDPNDFLTTPERGVSLRGCAIFVIGALFVGQVGAHATAPDNPPDTPPDNPYAVTNPNSAIDGGSGIGSASQHLDLLKETLGQEKLAGFAPGVAVKGPVTVTIARADGTTKRYIGARDILYFASPASVSRNANFMTFEGAVILQTKAPAGGAPHIEQGMVTVSGEVDDRI